MAAMFGSTDGTKRASRSFVAAVLVMLLLVLAGAMLVYATSSVSIPLSQVKVADPDTSDLLALVSPTTLENGRIWTDKSVSADQTVINTRAGTPLKVVDTTNTTDFSVLLSALSQGYCIKTVTTPSDVVFIIDVSGSMVQNDLGTQTRAAAMVDALNGAITQLMAANPENRVGVVAYGGERVPWDAGTRGIAREITVLPLGRYEIVGNHFTLSGSTILVNSQITAANPAIPTSFAVAGGTPTQLGIVRGAEMLMANMDTTFTDPDTSTTVVRRPNIILLTDGDPTFGWTDYTMAGATATNFDHGNGNPSDMGVDVLTVLTASYWKKQVSEHYYGISGGEATFYTIGVGVEGSHAPTVLDPANNAQDNTSVFGSTTYNAKTILDSFIATSAPITFPATLNVPDGMLTLDLALVSIANTAPTPYYITDYDYVDGYYPVDDSAALSNAFANIAQNIITSGVYATDTENTDPNFAGNVIIKDVIGQGFVFEQPQGFVIDDSIYNGSTLANDLVNNQTSANWNSYVTVLMNRLGISQTQAVALIQSSIASGNLYYQGGSDYSTKIQWYADSNLNYLGGYYSSGGAVQPAPAGATCTVALYSIEGVVTDPISGTSTDLMYLYFQVVTALQAGSFVAPQMHSAVLFRLEADQQAALWYIPASLIPQRTVKPQFDAPGSTTVVAVDIEEVAPIRACYTVGLRPDFDLDLFSSSYKTTHRNAAGDGYYFYTNDWNMRIDLDPSRTISAFVPNISNPYYYYTGDAESDGKTWLYTQSGGVFTIASSFSAGAQYYVRTEYFDATAAPSYLGESFQLLDSNTLISGTDAQPFIAYGTPRGNNRAVAKTSNITASLPNSFHEDSTLSGIVQQQILGNNGRFEVLFTAVPVEKVWQGEGEYEGVWIQLYHDPAPFVASDLLVPLRNPLYLGEINSWIGSFNELPLFHLTPDASGNLPLRQYSVQEGSYADGVFTPWIDIGGANNDIAIDIVQPEYEDGWSTAVVTNTRVPNEPNTPGDTPPGEAGKLGDVISVLLWMVILAIGLIIAANTVRKSTPSEHTR
ncbi:MAG: VWA domain-containing protein [Coriobacteriia bacterium]|nr:VWA domain-containing protein [Coriobacteriia bacterium]